MSVAKVSSCPIDLVGLLDHHRAWVVSPGQTSQVGPERRAQITLEGPGREGGDVADGGDTEGVEAPAGNRPDSPQGPDR